MQDYDPDLDLRKQQIQQSTTDEGLFSGSPIADEPKTEASTFANTDPPHSLLANTDPPQQVEQSTDEDPFAYADEMSTVAYDSMTDRTTTQRSGVVRPFIPPADPAIMPHPIPFLSTKFIEDQIDILPDDTPLESLLVALQKPDWQTRVAALIALTRLEDMAPTAAFVRGLADTHKNVRIAAVEAIAVLSWRMPVNLVELALVDSDPAVRSAAAWAAGQFGKRAPTRLLAAVAKDKTEQASVRASALQTLGLLRDATRIDLVRVLLEDKEWLVREAAVTALGSLGQPQDVALLVAVLKRDTEALVRVAAASSLARFTAGEEDFRFRLIEAMLKDPEPLVQEAARRALEMLGEF